MCIEYVIDVTSLVLQDEIETNQGIASVCDYVQNTIWITSICDLCADSLSNLS